MRSVFLIQKTTDKTPETLLVFRIKGQLFVVLPIDSGYIGTTFVSLWEEELTRMMPSSLEDSQVIRVESHKGSAEDLVSEVGTQTGKAIEGPIDVFQLDFATFWNPESDQGHLRVFFARLGLKPSEVFGFFRKAVFRIQSESPFEKCSSICGAVTEFQLESVRRIIRLFPFGNKLVYDDKCRVFYKEANEFERALELLLRLLFSSLLIVGFFHLTGMVSQRFFKLLPKLEIEENALFYINYSSYFFLFYSCMGAALLFFDPFLAFTMLALLFVYLKFCVGLLRAVFEVTLSFVWSRFKDFHGLLNGTPSPGCSEVVFKQESTNMKAFIAPLMSAQLFVSLFLGAVWLALKSAEVLSHSLSQLLLKLADKRSVGLLSLLRKGKLMKIDFLDKAGVVSSLNVSPL